MHNDAMNSLLEGTSHQHYHPVIQNLIEKPALELQAYLRERPLHRTSPPNPFLNQAQPLAS